MSNGPVAAVDLQHSESQVLAARVDRLLQSDDEAVGLGSRASF